MDSGQLDCPEPVQTRATSHIPREGRRRSRDPAGPGHAPVRGSIVLRRRRSMKWNIFVGSLVLSIAACTQSFGFDLLDRMLGSSGCGCESSCCETNCCKVKCARTRCCNNGCNSCAKVAPSCGVAAPSCVKAAPTCAAAAPTCAAAGPTCAAAPSCGADKGCGNGCGNKCCRPCLLDRLFSCHSSNSCNKGCGNGCGNGCSKAAPSCAAPSCGVAAPSCVKAAPACGCDAKAPAAAPAPGGDVAPMPPAPVVDPSAYNAKYNGRVVRSASLVR